MTATAAAKLAPGCAEPPSSPCVKPGECQPVMRRCFDGVRRRFACPRVLSFRVSRARASPRQRASLPGSCRRLRRRRCRRRCRRRRRRRSRQSQRQRRSELSRRSPSASGAHSSPRARAEQLRAVSRLGRRRTPRADEKSVLAAARRRGLERNGRLPPPLPQATRRRLQPKPCGRGSCGSTRVWYGLWRVCSVDRCSSGMGATDGALTAEAQLAQRGLVPPPCRSQEPARAAGQLCNAPGRGYGRAHSC